jgi:RHS repeat-associated protein
VWWDGDQALVEERSASGGFTDVSNSALVGNVHGLTLDEPLAVITPWMNEIRIINYNWRGQALSSVFPNGDGGDYSTGNASAEIDWPAATQSETYFTPAPTTNTSNNAKRWLGTFVANGQGTAGMLYRRNRYFDTKSGRFTQQDPIGVAGGLNAYGFAEGDPINFSDPFGLCVTCENEAMLKIQVEGVEQRTPRDVAILTASGIAAAVGAAAIMAQSTAAMALGGRVTAGAATAARIPNGELEKTFETAAGTVRVLGEAVSRGNTLTINNFLVYPDNAEKLRAGLSAMRAGFRGMEKIARDAGYSQVIVNYNRTSGINPGKIGQKVIDLISK